MKISFDFDSTLEFKEVQDVAKKLILMGYDVCILTTRYEDPSRYAFDATQLYQKLFDVANELGIEEIHFTNMEWKYKTIDKYDIDIHIDDDYRNEVYPINNLCKARAITYSYCWVSELEKLLNIKL